MILTILSIASLVGLLLIVLTAFIPNLPDIAVVGGFGLYVLSTLCNVFLNPFYGLSVFSILDIGCMLIFAAYCLACMTSFFPGIANAIKPFWFVPGCAYILVFVLSGIVNGFIFGHIVFLVLYCALYFGVSFLAARKANKA